MFYVYLLESISSNGHRYVGLTSNLKRRLHEHNSGQSSYTSQFTPWQLTTYVAFSDKVKAVSFERYLKSGSGHAFANKRLWSRSALPHDIDLAPEAIQGHTETCEEVSYEKACSK